MIEPSDAEVRQAFAARRLIEAALMREFVRVATAPQIQSLRGHLSDQHDAVTREDAPRRTHLLGDFHVRIADMLGNPRLVKVIAELVTRTNLMAMLYQSQREASHSADEHGAIVRAIEAGDADEAVRRMDVHLRNVEAGLQQALAVNPDPADRDATERARSKTASPGV